MALGIIGILIGLAALLLAVIALVKVSDVAGEFGTHQRSINESADALRHDLNALSKRVVSSPGSHTPAALPPDTKSILPPEAPHAPRMQVRPKKQIVTAAPHPPAPPKQPASAQPPQPPAQEQPEPVPVPQPAPADEGLFVNFDCAQCGQNIDAPAAMVGLLIPCPACRNPLSVPDNPPGPPRSMSLDESLGEGYPERGSLRDLADEATKGATVRIDIKKVFEELDKPKRQIVIKRRM
jgi:hypothetical protein